MFVAMGLSAIMPVIHGLNLYGMGHMKSAIGLLWLLLEGFLYTLGATIYAVSTTILGFNARLMDHTGSHSRAPLPKEI